MRIVQKVQNNKKLLIIVNRDKKLK